MQRITRFLGLVFAALALGAVAGPAAGQQAPPKLDLDNSFWSMPMEGFFPGQTRGKPKRLNVYMVRRDGKFVSALGTPTVDGKAAYNTAIMPVDASGLALDGNRLTGTLKIILVADPWVPKDRKNRSATATVDVTVTPNPTGDPPGHIRGTFKATFSGEEQELTAAGLAPTTSGNIAGGLASANPVDVSDASYDLAVYQLIPGKTSEEFQRRRAVSVGVKDGKGVSVRLGQMDIRHNMYDYVDQETPADFTAEGDLFRGTIELQADSLDGEPVSFKLTLSGNRVANWLVGTYKGTCRIADGPERPIEGYLRGDVRKGAYVSEAAKDDRPWFVQVPGHRAVQPGEHPRLFFRKEDLPELKRRAATPDGQRIIKRLRELLNGSDGETMTTLFNPATKAYDTNKYKARTGAYTISHAAGYGFLYQLTGDRKYAGFARECVEKAWAGQRSSDDRYSWVAPGGELRAGPSIGWYAVAYDLCYDAWDADFRVKVAKAIQDYNDEKGGEWAQPQEGGISLRKMILQPKQGPGSNHYGAVVGGSGLAVLAIMGDPGTDKQLLEKYLSAIEKQVVRHFLAGWGDCGYYKEGWGASRVGTQGGFLCLLQALKVAAGHDYLNVDRTSASYVTMVPRCLMMLGPPAHFPYRSNMGPSYGNPEIGSPGENDGMSHGGYFSEGFGAIADKFKPGLLWTYNHVFSPDNKFNFDTYSPYPHRAMLALINWPTFAGVQEQNPAGAMPKVTRDHLYEYFVFRNGWKDRDSDIVTTVAINYPDGTKPRDVMVWGLGGLRLNFGEPRRGAKVTHFLATGDGSGSLAAGDWALAVDYSRSAGCDALIVSVGGAVKPPADSPKVKFQTASARQVTFNVMTLSASGEHPTLRVDGDRLAIGGQTVSFEGGKIVLGKTAAPAKTGP